MHIYVNISVCENTLKGASTVATTLHMIIMFLCLLLMPHLYICSYNYTQTNPIRSREQSKRWHDYKECHNSRLQRANRPFHRGALRGLKSFGKIQQMCNEERWRREPRQKGTLWLRSARMPTQTGAQSNQTKTAIEVLAGTQTKNIPRPRQGKRLTDQVNLQRGDRCAFECFLTPLHCEGKLCFSLSSRGWLIHKCWVWGVVENNNNTGGKREKRKSKCVKKATWLQKNKWLDFRTAGQLVSLCWWTGLGTFFCFRPCIYSLPDIQTDFHALGEKNVFFNQGWGWILQKNCPITECVADGINKI